MLHANAWRGFADAREKLTRAPDGDISPAVGKLDPRGPA